MWAFPHYYWGKFPKEGVTESRSRHGDMSLEHNCRVVLLMPVVLMMFNNNCRVLFLVTYNTITMTATTTIQKYRVVILMLL